MTTIRICEESEARLMIGEGSFRDYVQKWSERFPQKPKFQTIKEIHDRQGYGLRDAMLLSRAMGIDDGVFFEVGEKVCLRKMNDNLAVFRKVGTIWVKTAEGMDALDSAGLFDDSFRVGLALCTEADLLNCKSVAELACKVEKRMQLCRYDATMMSFGNHEIWVWDSDTYKVHVYSRGFTDKDFPCFDDKDVADEIRRYRETYGFSFGVM